MRVTVFVVMVICMVCASEAKVANLTEACFRCLCMAPTRCSAPKRCFGDFCGPFNLSKDYWLDAGQPTLLNDDPERKGAFEDCAKDYECAKTIVAGYLEKFVTDCNNDGVIDCLDHMMVNANGGYDCSTPLETTTVGRRWLAAYEKSFEDCAKDYECAKTIVAGYLEKFVTDCNNDGVIDCLDHMMVNANGGYDCSTPLETTTVGRRWLAAYEKCKVDL